MNDSKISVTPMPKSCYGCPMYISKGWGDLKDYCHITFEEVWDRQYQDARHETCPLEEVKE